MRANTAAAWIGTMSNGAAVMPRRRQWFAPAHDLFVASVSLPAALVLRVGTEHLPDYFNFLSYGTPLFCAIAAGVFPRCGLYKGLWRYASLADLTAIVKGAAISVLLFVVLVFIFERVEGLPRSV